VTIAKRPSKGNGTAADIILIWVKRERNYFRYRDWTASISLIRLDKSSGARSFLNLES